MDQDPVTTRSRRALLTAAAGAAGAIVASAALPLTAAAHDADDVALGTDNATTAQTTLTNSAADSTALGGHATGTGVGFGVEGTSAGAAGVFAWSVAAPDAGWFTPSITSHTGVFGSAPAGDGVNTFGTGVWGDSPDAGVYGSGAFGVIGNGFVGVEGDANDNAGSIGVWAWAPSTAQVALKVTGKVSLSRSGRVAMSTKAVTKLVSLTGVTTTSKVFAVLSTSESGRWVRAVVPATGKFTIYLNAALTSSAVVSWFVLD
jgi:hypothetical protein